MILAFVSLGEEDYEIDIKKVIRFLHYLYKYRVRYVDNVAEICLKLNDDGNCSIVLYLYYFLARLIIYGVGPHSPSKLIFETSFDG